jgi:hypothetical protein
MATKPHSNFRKVVQALVVLNPQQIHDPIDARDIAAVTDLSAKQASPCLSILKSLGYLAKVGSNDRCNSYIRTSKPLTVTFASLLKTYRARLTKKDQRNCNVRQLNTSTEKLTAMVEIPTQNLRQLRRSPRLPNGCAQLPLFPLILTSALRSQGKESRPTRRS